MTARRDFPEMDAWLPVGFEDKEQSSANARTLIPSFQMQIRLATIMQRMLGQLFSAKCNLSGRPRNACIDDLNLDLCRWETSLVKPLQWNRWQPTSVILPPTVATLQ